MILLNEYQTNFRLSIYIKKHTVFGSYKIDFLWILCVLALFIRLLFLLEKEEKIRGFKYLNSTGFFYWSAKIRELKQSYLVQYILVWVIVSDPQVYMFACFH